ncbi:MAG: hypothetical protein IPM57_03070 [Oligoflexia bacterium]|nr:hypothetical protein [Oligoflexia bacterium]
MKNFLLILFLIIPAFAQAQLHAELGFGFTAGGNNYNELASGYTVGHDETFMSFGLGLMGRLGIKIANVSITASLFHDWEGSSLTYQPSNQSLFASGAYAITNRRFGYGPSVMLLIPAIDISVFGEYYPYVNNTIQWAETKSQNPFHQNDWLTGWGFALGVGKMMFGKVHAQAAYRSVNYTKVSLNGTETAIPGARFDKAHWGGVFIGGAYSF